MVVYPELRGKFVLINTVFGIIRIAFIYVAYAAIFVMPWNVQYFVTT